MNKQPKSQGQLDYEKNVAETPYYNDGTPRKTWDELEELAKSTWLNLNG